MNDIMVIKKEKGKFVKFIRNYGWCYIFIAAPVLVFFGFTLYPLLRAFIMSFQEYNVMGSKFVGLDNYKEILKDSIFWKSLRNTIIYTIGTVPVNVSISLGLALLIFRLKKSSQTFFKAAFYLPVVASGVTMALVWYWIYDPTHDGLLNTFIGWFGFTNINWLGTTRTALFSLMLMTYLGGHGGAVILYLAARGGIPKTIYEVADIESANSLKKFSYITWPLLKPTTLYLIVTGVIGSFQVFMNVYIMTQGGPDHATATIAYLIYQHAFEYFEFGHAAAESFILALIIIGISVLQFKYMGSDVEY